MPEIEVLAVCLNFRSVVMYLSKASVSHFTNIFMHMKPTFFKKYKGGNTCYRRQTSSPEL